MGYFERQLDKYMTDKADKAGKADKADKAIFTPKKCHTGNRLAFEYSGVEWYGGGSSRGASVDMNIDLLIDVGGRLTRTVEYHNFESVRPLRRIVVEWRDMSTPDLDLADWKRLIKVVYQEKDIRKVLVSCIGGHGRTGTTLAIIGALLAARNYGRDCIHAVRQFVCSECVETDGQVRYIANITGQSLEKYIHNTKWAGFESGFETDKY